MFEALQQASGADPFMPHGMCYLWEPELLWMHVAADTLTWLAYWAIPPALIYLAVQARRQTDEESGLPYEWIFWAFGIFIVACGGTHLMAVWTVWNPDYWFSGGVKVVTALASVTTAVALPPLVPRILDLVREARLSDSRRRRLEGQNRELATLNARLREAEAARSRFFANISHELRTPLTLVLGPVDELLSEENLSGVHRSLLRSVRRNAHGLLQQVDDLLEVAHMEGDGLPVRPAEIELAERVRETAEGFRALAPRRGAVRRRDPRGSRRAAGPRPDRPAAPEPPLQRLQVRTTRRAGAVYPGGGLPARGPPGGGGLGPRRRRRGADGHLRALPPGLRFR